MFQIVLIVLLLYISYKFKRKNVLVFILNISDDHRLLIELYNYLKTKCLYGHCLKRLNDVEKTIYLSLRCKDCVNNDDLSIYKNKTLYTNTKESLLKIKAIDFQQALDGNKINNLYAMNKYIDNILIEYINSNKSSLLNK